jgi:hypothetical protein
MGLAEHSLDESFWNMGWVVVFGHLTMMLRCQTRIVGRLMSWRPVV